MAHSVEEEELADYKSLDEHHEGRRQHGEKAYDVANADGVEDDVTWACQGTFEERHAYGLSEVTGKRKWWSDEFVVRRRSDAREMCRVIPKPPSGVETKITC